MAMRRIRHVGVLLTIALAVACGGPAADGDRANDPGGGKADDSASASLTIIPAQTWTQVIKFQHYFPTMVHYGMVTGPGADWEGVADVQIGWQESQKDVWENLPVAVEVPEDQTGYLAFTIFSKAPGFAQHAGDTWSPVQYIDLRHRVGRMQKLPLWCAEGAPFADQYFEVGVKDGTQEQKFPGKVTKVFYGFTLATAAQYAANRDVPWLNAAGEAAADGILSPKYIHDDYTGEPDVMAPLYVRVPSGYNLVFKIAFDKFGPEYRGVSQDTYYIGSAETQTYFVEMSWDGAQ